MSHFIDEIPFLGTFQLVRGMDFSKTFYLGTLKEIESSTDANPSVITITNHGYSNSQKKQIRDHQGNRAINNTSANPFHTITVIDSHTFSVPIDGSGTGSNTGTVLTPQNLTGLVAGTGVKCQWRKFGMDTLTAGSSNVLFTPTLAIDVAAEGTITISVDKALTYTDAVGGLTLDKYRADILVVTGAGVDTIFGRFDIECVKSVTR